MEVRWALSARADLFAIADHYDGIDPDITDAMLARIGSAPAILREHPRAGEPVGRDLRKWRVRRTAFALLYRVREGHVEIARVVHAATDWRRHP